MQHYDGRKTITREREDEREECRMNEDQMKRARKKLEMKEGKDEIKKTGNVGITEHDGAFA
jgi:hypothetical protein